MSRIRPQWKGSFSRICTTSCTGIIKGIRRYNGRQKAIPKYMRERRCRSRSRRERRCGSKSTSGKEGREGRTDER